MRPDERDRLTEVFGAYSRDPRRRRAWAAENPGNLAIRRELSEATLAVLAQGDPGGTILDAGCGAGWWLEQLRDAGVPADRLTGVELLDARVQVARARVPAADISCADIRSLPLPDAGCALITYFTVLSGMPGPDDVASALAEARRVLAPGGAIVAWEPRLPTRNPDTRLITLTELRRCLGPALSVRSLTLAPPLARRIPGLYRPLAAIPLLRSHRFVVARPH